MHQHRPSRRAALAPSLTCALAASLLATAHAEPPKTTPPVAEALSAPTPTVRPERRTLDQMTAARVTLDAKESRLEDVFTFLKTVTQADLEPLWADANNDRGLDKERPITIKLNEVPALRALERILEQASESSDTATWQLTDTGALQCGPRSRLNATRRLVTYDIKDLLLEVPDYTDAPKIDLQQALQSSQGGGGQGPFTDADSERQRDDQRKQRLTEDLLRLIRETVEPEQWDTAGGVATMRVFRDTLLVNAPDYVHRGLNGYPFWPAESTSIRTDGGRRTVTLDPRGR